MAKAHEPIKLTFLREGELSIDNSILVVLHILV